MKRKKTNWAGMLCLSLIFPFLSGNISAQQVIYQENFGTPSGNTLVQDYTGWQDTIAIYSGDGTCDIRSSNASSGYGLASGAGNVMINDTVKWFMVSGINTSAENNLSLYCGLRKTTAENGSNFVVEVSNDGAHWTRLFLTDTLPTGAGTSGWHRVRYTGVPATTNLHVRFSNSANVDYRLDDIAIVVGEETTLETVAKPAFSPTGGTYYEPQTVTIFSPTPGATIYYTLDNSIPDSQSNLYQMPLTINGTTTLKAIAIADDMYDSEIATASYILLDTNSLVELPFDISDNSSVTHADIVFMDGFRGYHLGTSYADGSVKFETAHAGEACLVAHLDSAPDTLVFELKGMNGGSNPSAYEGASLSVSYSGDGHTWNPLATIFGADISVNGFTRFAYYITDHSARYVRWKLETSVKGNTQLNNIKITQHSDNGDSTSTPSFHPEVFSVYPNPTTGLFYIHTDCNQITSMVLYNIFGQAVYSWPTPSPTSPYSIYHLPQGTYILKANTPYGTMQKKIVYYR